MKSRASLAIIAIQIMFLAGGLTLNAVLGTKPVAAAAQAAAQATTPLGSEEQSGLAFMHEEEKLARDVYAALYQRWRLQIFNNIANSEQNHMDALRAIETARGLPNATLPAAGKFNDPELQKLYDELVAQGSKSLTDALKVGAAIEEIDIRDLNEKLAKTTDAALRTAYGNLLRGSYNHLKSFTGQLQREGVNYTPQYLDASTYANALAAATARGPNR